MKQTTLQALAEFGERLARAARAAESQGIEAQEVIGIGGFSLVYAARTVEYGECVLKLPWVVPHNRDWLFDRTDVPAAVRVTLVSPTGPYVLESPHNLTEAARLLTSSAERIQSHVAGLPLAQVHAILDLDGLPGVLEERLTGFCLRNWLRCSDEVPSQMISPLAKSVQSLHEGPFGPHGDLKPDHAFLDRQTGEIRWIDPLVSACWLGTPGYTLNMPVGQDPGSTWWEPKLFEELRRLKDLGALAAIVAEMFGGSLGWGAETISAMANQDNGRFGRGFDPPAVRESHRIGTANIEPPALREWVIEMADATFDAGRLKASRLPEPGFSRDALQRVLAMRL